MLNFGKTWHVDILGFGVLLLLGMVRRELKSWLGLVAGDALIVIAMIGVGLVHHYIAWIGSNVQKRQPEGASVESKLNGSQNELPISSTAFFLHDQYKFVGAFLILIGAILVVPGIYVMYLRLSGGKEVASLYFGLSLGFLILIAGLIFISSINRLVAQKIREREVWKKKLAIAGSKYTISEFQRRRKRLIPFALVPFVLGVGILSITFIGAKSTGGRLIGEAAFWALSGFVIAVAGVGFFGLTYTCPICNQPPTGTRRRAGVSLNPDSCPTCGAPLSDDYLSDSELKDNP